MFSWPADSLTPQIKVKPINLRADRWSIVIDPVPRVHILDQTIWSWSFYNVKGDRIITYLIVDACFKLIRTLAHFELKPSPMSFCKLSKSHHNAAPLQSPFLWSSYQMERTGCLLSSACTRNPSSFKSLWSFAAPKRHPRRGSACPLRYFACKQWKWLGCYSNYSSSRSTFGGKPYYIVNSFDLPSLQIRSIWETRLIFTTAL
jgi:hypothetical protein